MLFQRTIPRFTLAPVTAVKAKLIYELLKTKSPQEIRVDDGYKMIHIQEVLVEATRLESLIRKELAPIPAVPSVVITPAEVDGDGNVTKEAVMSVAVAEKESALTKTSLLAKISSSLLTKATVVDDVVAYSLGDPDNSPTYDNFKISLKSDV